MVCEYGSAARAECNQVFRCDTSYRWRSDARVACTTGTGEGKEKSYVRVPLPNEVNATPRASYLHVTSNETIHGVEYEVDPSRPFPRAADVPLVADMSSDFLWRKFDVSRFALVYAGAQKNIGPSGVVVVIASQELVSKVRKDIKAQIMAVRAGFKSRQPLAQPTQCLVTFPEQVFVRLKFLAEERKATLIRGDGGLERRDFIHSIFQHLHVFRHIRAELFEFAHGGIERGAEALIFLGEALGRGFGGGLLVPG